MLTVETIKKEVFPWASARKVNISLTSLSKYFYRSMSTKMREKIITQSAASLGSQSQDALKPSKKKDSLRKPPQVLIPSLKKSSLRKPPQALISSKKKYSQRELPQIPSKKRDSLREPPLNERYLY
jgi:hypothetical protein